MPSLTGGAARATGNPGINNTAWLFFILALAFLFYVTVKGDLPKWLGLLGLASGATPASATSPTAAGTASAAGGLPGLPAIPSIGQTSSGVGNLPSTSNPFGSISSDASNANTYSSGDLAPGNVGSSQIIDVFGEQE